jgi:hypothetical protein
VYLFVSIGENLYLPPSGFSALVAPQPQVASPRVVNVVPLEPGTGNCVGYSLTAPNARYAALATELGGLNLDYCDTDWSDHAEAVAELLR